MAVSITLPSNFQIASGAAVGGPLASLVAQNNSLQILHYPRDLSSDRRGHYVQFTVQKIKEITFDEVEKWVTAQADAMINGDQQHEELFTSTSTAKGSLVGSAMNMVGDIKDAITTKGFSASASAAWNLVKSSGAAFYDLQQKLTKQNTETMGYINLYMPETVNFSYNSQYNSLSLMEAAASVPLVGKLATGINSFMQNNAVRLLLNRAGYVFNPQQQLLFEGIDFRTFQMSFTFSPVSKEEADEVTNIIKMFRMYAAPQIVRQAGGMFFIPPALFSIQFYQNGNVNPNIHQLETCVIENIDVNYAPNGWAAHSDGQPVQTVVTISFKENVLIDREKIASGY